MPTCRRSGRCGGLTMHYRHSPHRILELGGQRKRPRPNRRIRSRVCRRSRLAGYESRATEQGLGTEVDVVITRPRGAGARVCLDGGSAVLACVRHRRPDQQERDAASTGGLAYGNTRDNPDVLAIDAGSRARCLDAREFGPGSDSDPPDRLIAFEGEQTGSKPATCDLSHRSPTMLACTSPAWQPTRLCVCQTGIHAPTACAEVFT